MRKAVEHIAYLEGTIGRLRSRNEQLQALLASHGLGLHVEEMAVEGVLEENTDDMDHRPKRARHANGKPNNSTQPILAYGVASN